MMTPQTTTTNTEPLAGEQLERRLEELLHQDRFPPPARFLAREQVNEAALDAQANLDPLGFWAEQARQLHWDEPFDTVLDDSDPPFYRWFVDGELNASYNCLDRHVEAGLGNRVAYYWAGEEGEQRALTYGELHRDVQRLANALKALGIRKGDVVGIYLPMIPEVVAAMLACARIGAPHNVVFGGFAPEAVRERMEVSGARALITADGARRKGKTAPVKAAVDEVMGDLPSLEHVVVVRHTGIDLPMGARRDVFYDEIVAAADPVCPAEPMEAEHPLFILYSSGSTAKPKGILHTTGGYLSGVVATHRYVFDLDPERDVYFCTADVGWITGHSYIVYAPLANGATSVMYEGAPDYPHKGIWWELVERYGVSIFYTAPTAIRACMKWGAEHPNAHDLSSLRLLGTVGEPITPRPGSGTTWWSAGSAARSSIRGGRPRPARS
jgi:acetyl-CoA synthetase